MRSNLWFCQMVLKSVLLRTKRRCQKRKNRNHAEGSLLYFVQQWTSEWCRGRGGIQQKYGGGCGCNHPPAFFGLGKAVTKSNSWRPLVGGESTDSPFLHRGREVSAAPEACPLGRPSWWAGGFSVGAKGGGADVWRHGNWELAGAQPAELCCTSATRHPGPAWSLQTSGASWTSRTGRTTQTHRTWRKAWMMRPGRDGAQRQQQRWQPGAAPGWVDPRGGGKLFVSKWNFANEVSHVVFFQWN